MEIKKAIDGNSAKNTTKKGNKMSIFKQAYGEWLNDLDEFNKNGLVPALNNIFGEENVFVIDDETDTKKLFSNLTILEGGEND